MTSPIKSTKQTTETASKPGACTSSTTSVVEPLAKSGCCGGPATSDATACCVADEKAKASGKSGCGCGAKPATAKEPSPCGG